MWPDSLPEHARVVYQRTLDLLRESYPDPSVFSKIFVDLLDRQLEVLPSRVPASDIAVLKKKLLGERERMDPLIRRFREWAADELALREKSVPRISTRRTRSLRVPPQYRRYLLVASLKEIANLVAHDLTPSECVTLATRGDEKSLLRLVELDKVFLTARFARDWFSDAQARSDTRFFKRLAKSVQKDTLTDVMPTARLGIACYLLWFLGFEKLGKRPLLEFVEAEGLVKYDDPKSFDRFTVS